MANFLNNVTKEAIANIEKERKMFLGENHIHKCKRYFPSLVLHLFLCPCYVCHTVLVSHWRFFLIRDICVCMCAFPSFPPGLLAIYQHENDAIKYFSLSKTNGFVLSFCEPVIELCYNVSLIMISWKKSRFIKVAIINM